MDFDYRLLAKYLTGMLSPEEMKQVEEWRELSIDNEEVFSELMKLRVSWKFTQYNTPEHIEEALNGLNAKINSRRRFQILRSVMRYAAVILLFVSFSYVGWGYLKPDNCVTQRKFRCVINEDESLPDILKLLKYLAPIQYRIEGKEILLAVFRTP